MLAVFSRGGFPVKSHLEDGIVHVSISLTGDAK
jgi:hypothetical protein